MTRTVHATLGCLLAAGCLWTAAAAEARMTWLDLEPDGDLATTKAGIEADGGTILTLAAEGRLLVKWPPGQQVSASCLAGVAGMESVVSRRLPEAPEARGEGTTGWRRAPEERRKALADVCQQVQRVKPNELSRRRALLEGKTGRPSAVDNTLSKYFPWIGNQLYQGSCTTWAACHYWNTYTHAADEDLDTWGIDARDHQSSAAFLFNLLNEGNEGGSDILEVMAGLRDLGCSSWARMPYDSGDLITWPSEAAWVDALRRRTSTCRAIGAETGCTDEDLEAIKQHLANGNVAVVGLAAHASWSGWQGEDKPGFNNGVLYANSGAYRGGHGLALAGYDDERPYFDGVTTRQGAFLVVNAWGWYWGVPKPFGPDGTVYQGSMWVGYDYFKTANAGFDELLGIAFFNDDRSDYRPQLYVVAGLNHDHRGDLACRAGIGSEVSPDWVSHLPFTPHYYSYPPIGDDRRVAIDCTDGLPAITDYDDVSLFVELTVDGGSSSSGTISSADFFYDFRGAGVLETVRSDDPVVTIPPGGTDHVTVHFAQGALAVSPGMDFDQAALPLAPVSFSSSGPEGGPFLDVQPYTLVNEGTASLSWSASASTDWIELSAESGNLDPGAQSVVDVSVAASATSLPANVYDDEVIFLNETDVAELKRLVRLEARPVNAFFVDVSPVIGPPHVPRALTITATDIEGATVGTVSGPAALRALARTNSTGIGTPDWPATTFMAAYYFGARLQPICLSEEVGSAGLLVSLALQVERVPGRPLRNWTIRMKHTTLSEYTAQLWENTGWTTVYRRHQAFTKTGRVEIIFDTPFEYNGTDNLMVDFSFGPQHERSDDGRCYFTSTEGHRSLGWHDPTVGSTPLLWAGDSPEPWFINAVPYIEFGRGREVSISPEVSGSLEQGVWSGTVTALEEALAVHLVVAGGGCGGSSARLDFFYGSDGDGDGLTYEDETRDLDPETPGVQNPFDPDDADCTGDNGDWNPDGIPDGANDWDGDGMTNSEEFQWGFDPLDETDFGTLPAASPIALGLLVGLHALMGAALSRRRR